MPNCILDLRNVSPVSTREKIRAEAERRRAASPTIPSKVLHHELQRWFANQTGGRKLKIHTIETYIAHPKPRPKTPKSK